MPKISVIIPVYNTEKYLKECIDSVVNQTLQDIEIVCVDDGSTDSSLDILNNYKKDPRLVVLSQKHQGAGCARNLALEVAQGKYLAFIDSDDFYDIDFNHLPFKQGHPLATKKIAKPKGFDEMVRLAKLLSQGMPHVRVDFYDINGKIYFGEFTFFHFSGNVPFEPDEWDYRVGEWLQLPKGSV